MLILNFFDATVVSGIQNTNIDEFISVHDNEYQLIASSYGNGKHFVVRFLWNKVLYFYDGLQNSGNPTKVNTNNKFPTKMYGSTINTLLYKKI